MPEAVDEDTLSVTRRIVIEAPRVLVFSVLTEPEQLGQWFGQAADFPDGVAAGAEGSFGWTEHGVYPARVERYHPPVEFAFTWGTPGEPLRDNNSTTATFRLEETASGTEVTVTETGFDQIGDEVARRAAMEETADGWRQELDDLSAQVAGLAGSPGTGLPARANTEAGRIVRSVLVRTDQVATWNALTDPAAIEAWWGHPAVFPDGLAAGRPGTFEWVGHGLMPIRIEHFDAPVRFEFHWGELDEPQPGPDASLVSFTLVGVDDVGTIVTVVETGFGGLEGARRRAALEENVRGWQKVLDSFVAHIEFGQGAA